VNNSMDLMTEEETEQLLAGFNDTATDYPSGKTVHRLFEEQVARTPDAVAVYGSYRTYKTYMTYSGLNRRADQLVSLLREKGVRPGAVVGIMVERSVEMIVGILGILKAGSAYMAIDPGYPEERKRYMLADSGATFLLTARDIKGCREQACLFQARTAPDNDAQTSNTLCYIIYTSGSTGRPKGVMVEHRNVVRLVKNTNFVSFSETLKILQTGALEFDASTFEIWGALLNGGSLYLVDKDVILEPGELNVLIGKHRITTLWLTSSLFNRMVDADIDVFRGLRHLLVGGEALSPVHINRVRGRFPGLEVINGYGPTENTTFSTTFSIDRDYSQNIPIGRPIANSTAYILDPEGGLVPVGVSGELIVGGDGVSRGYLNNPELTGKKFSWGSRGSRGAGSHLIMHPVWQNTGEQIPPVSPHIGPPCHGAPGRRRQRFYKTGDLARWLSDGNIEFLGRIDQQVKLRGFRIELGEIETQLLRHPDIREAVVVVRGEESVDKYLCAYIVPGGPVPVPALEQFLAQTLPGYMVPAHFVVLEKIPLTANGKVDRNALPAPEIASSAEYAAPRDPMEKKLAELWSEVLGIAVDRIGIHDDFFELGGHSLSGTSLASAVHKTFNVRLPLPRLFEMPVFAELSRYIKTAAEDPYRPLGPVEEKEYYPLSSAQQRFYVLQQMDPGSESYNITEITQLEGELESEGLETAFRKLIRRHESLRTSFRLAGNGPVQEIHERVEFKIETHGDPRIDRFVRAFDLSRAPLFRVGIVKTGENRHLLMVDMSHIISDGISLGLFIKDFIALYDGQSLPPLPLRYRDYAGWQNRRLDSGELDEQERYWLREFSGEFPHLDLPLDFPRPPVRDFRGDHVDVEAGAKLTEELKRHARKTGSTLYMVLLAAYALLLFKYTGNETVVIGSPDAGRSHADLDNIIGLFVNTLALKLHLDHRDSFDQIMAMVKEKVMGAFENRDYPFDLLVDKLGFRRDAGRNPLFDTLFIFQDLEIGRMAVSGLNASPYPYKSKTSPFDLWMEGVEIEDNIVFSLGFCTKLFKRETVERLGNHFTGLLDRVIENPNLPVSEIELISGKEREQLLERIGTDREGDEYDFI